MALELLSGTGTAMVRQERPALVVRQDGGQRATRAQAGKPAGALNAKRATSATGDLGDAALVELTEIDGDLHALVLSEGQWRHRRLATANQVRSEVGHLRLALCRLAYGGAHTCLGTGAGQQLARAGAALDDLVLTPIRTLLGSRPVFIVPTPDLHAVPWAALPTLAGRSVSVAPSARLWLGTKRSRWTASAGRGHTVVVAGPGLPGAGNEAARLASLYPHADLLTGERASMATVLTAMAGADLAHIAAHAHFRADNGLWSGLELADGPLTAYQMGQLRRPPRVVVLSACQSGLSTVRPGQEMMGFVGALLALGTETVVASVVPVEDKSSEALMVAFHERLLAGGPPAKALAAAQVALADSVGLSYVCFGRKLPAYTWWRHTSQRSKI